MSIWLDGSYFKTEPGVTYGGVVVVDDAKDECVYCQRYYTEKPEFVSMNNVGGELLAAILGFGTACARVIDKHQGEVECCIYHDYNGIAKFATGEWAAKKEGSQMYVIMFNHLKSLYPHVRFKFVKVKGLNSTVCRTLVARMQEKASPFTPLKR